MSAGVQASAVGRATSALTFFSPHLAVITLLGGHGVRLLPLSHLSYGFCPRLSNIWRCFGVRRLSGILPLPFSLSGHIRSAIFSVRSRSHFSGRLPLRMQCIPYPCTKFPAAAAAGTAQQAWAPTFDMKTCNEFQPFPRMYPHDGWCLFPARYVQVNNTRCTSRGIHQSHEYMWLVLNSQPGLRKS